MTNRSYQLPTETLPALTRDAHLDDINEFILLLESLNIKTSGTRIARYKTYLENLKGHSKPDISMFDVGVAKEFDEPNGLLLYILRELHEIMWILKGLKCHFPKGAEEKLKSIVGGRDFARLDKNTSSRNAQFELRIASYFCQGGYLVDLSTLTDIVASKGRIKYYIECKRVTSLGALKKRLVYARKQLIRRIPKSSIRVKYYGIIAIDVTKVAFSQNGLTMGFTAEHSKDVIQDKLKEIDEQILNRGFSLGRNDFLLTWLQIHISALVVHPTQFTTRFSSFFAPNEKMHGRYKKAFVQLQKVLHIGDVGDIREEPKQKLIRREVIIIPKGAEIRVEDNSFLGFLKTGTLEDLSPDTLILTIKYKDETIKFIGEDLQMVIPLITDEEKLRYLSNFSVAMVEITAKLLQIKFPYEGEIFSKH